MSKNKQDSQKTFKTPFSPLYWKTSARELLNIRILVLAALFIAIRVAMSVFFIQVSDNLRIYFSFLAMAVGSMICGPIIALISGFIGDILGYLFAPSGAFFPGYTLSSMLGAFIFALFLYRTRISIIKIFTSKFLINFLVNAVIGSIWSTVLSGKGYYFYFAKSLVKNAIMLPIEVILLVLLLQIIIPIAARLHIIPNQPKKKLPFI